MADLECCGEYPWAKDDELIADRVCPKCSSKMRFDKNDWIAYCTSMSCRYFDYFIPALQLAVTGRGLGDSSAVADSAERSASVSAPAPVIIKNKTGGMEMGKYEEIEKELEYQTLRGEKWTPEPGDRLIGEVLKIGEPIIGKNKDGSDKKTQLIVVKDENGKLWTVWKSKALEELFAKVMIGNTVGLKFIGKQSIKTGGTFKKIEFVLKPVS